MGCNYAFTQFETRKCVILEVSHSDVLNELVTRHLLGWVYMACPGMAVVCGIKSLDNMEALNIFVKKVEEFNKQSASKKQDF